MTFSINDVLNYVKDISAVNSEELISVDEALYEITQIRKNLEKVSENLSRSDTGYIRLSLLRAKDLESRLCDLLVDMDENEELYSLTEHEFNEPRDGLSTDSLNDFLYKDIPNFVKSEAKKENNNIHSDDMDIDLSQYFGTYASKKQEPKENPALSQNELFGFDSFIYGILAALNSSNKK